MAKVSLTEIQDKFKGKIGTMGYKNGNLILSFPKELNDYDDPIDLIKWAIGILRTEPLYILDLEIIYDIEENKNIPGYSFFKEVILVLTFKRKSNNGKLLIPFEE